MIRIFVVLFFVGSLGGGSACLARQVSGDTESDRLFALEVFPILESKCFACHDGTKDATKGGLDLASHAKMLIGGESGEPAFVVGNPDESILVEAIQWDGLEMPPKANDRLTEDQVASIRKWIELGGDWPGEAKRIAIRAAAAEKNGESDIAPEEAWAFRPLGNHRVPKHAEHPIDAFVLDKLVAANIELAPVAKPETLIRRATYDLIGLPPEPRDVEQFRQEWSKDSEKAWRNLIERLLASPHYGERWAQHWLDVVRYADTSGFSNDFERSNAWRYRDYVVRAFNDDKPYNNFIVEQIAGDELVLEQQSNADGRNHDKYVFDHREGPIATGFLRMGPWEHTPMSPTKISRQIYLDDVTDGVGQTFLSTPLRCAKCHDHKFDPIPTRDYYRFYAAFATTQLAELPAEFLETENRVGFEEQKNHVQTLLDFAKSERGLLLAKREKAARKWYADRGRGDEYVPWKERSKASFEGEKPPRFIGLTTAEEGTLKVREQDVRIWSRRLERFQPLAQAVYYGGEFVINSRKLRKPNPGNRWQMKPGVGPPVSRIYTGGSVYAAADVVTPGVLSATKIATRTASKDDPFALPTGMERRRVALARWIARPDNPLTTRSIVNRIWAYHFGAGIAGNPNNFGATGKRPTHPELLDWLAKDFVRNGWSIKQLHRKIMTSNVYQASCEHPDREQLNRIDPDNHLLAVFQPRRLSAEEIRDSMLMVSGELNQQVGGLPVRPEINLEVALSPRMIQSSLAPAYQPERTPQLRNRRSIYAYRIRGMSDPLMEVFDKPNSNDSCEVRDSASVTPQVFTLMNSDVVTNRSIALALKLETNADSVAEQISAGYELTTGKTIADSILQKLISHHKTMVAYHRTHAPKPPVYPTRIKRSLVEEFSGEPFDYVERLDVYENYVRDKSAADVGPETRALADICLLLFNANEFIYVY